MPDEALYESCKIKDLKFNKTSKQYRSTLTKKIYQQLVSIIMSIYIVNIHS